MAQNRINLSPEDQQMFEEYFKQKSSPSNIPFNAGSAIPASEKYFDSNPFPYTSMLPQSDILSPSKEEVPQQNNIPFYELPFEKQVAPIAEAQTPIASAPKGGPQAPIHSLQQALPPGPQEPSPMQNLLSQYKNLYSSDQLQSDADGMNKALDRKKELSILDMFMKGGSQLMSGIAQTKPGEVIQTAGLADIDIEKAKQKSGLTDRQRQALEAQMKILDVEEMNDPNSPTSKVYRQTLQDIAPSIASMSDLKNASAMMINKIIPQVKMKLDNEARIAQHQLTLSMKHEQMDQRKLEEERRKNSLFFSSAQKLKTQDKRFGKLQEQGMNFDQIDTLIDAAKKGNEASVAAIGTKLARAMGEVGVLTDTDVTRYLGNLSYGRKINSWFSKGMNGILPKPQIKEIQEVVDIMKHLQSTQIMPLYNEYASQLVSNFPGELTPDEALSRLGAPGYTKRYISNEKSKDNSSDDVEALKWLKQNPNDKNADAIRQRLMKKGIL